MQISLKILLVLITFSLSILAALTIILVLYFSGLQSIEDEASRLSTSRISLSILKLETKILKIYDVLQSVTNFTTNRVPNLFESNLTVQSAITQSVRTSALLNSEFSFPAVMTRYVNGDVFFLRSGGEDPQTVVGQSEVAFYVQGSTTTPQLDIIQNLTRHRYNFTTLTDLPTDDSVWVRIDVGRPTYVNAENWNVSALRTAALPSFLQVPVNSLADRALGRTTIFFYPFAISGYDSASNAGQLSSARTMNQFNLFLDFIAADVLEPFLIDPVRSRAFLVDTRGFDNTGSVVSQTHGGLSFEVVNLTNPIPTGCHQGRTQMGCFYNISDHPPFSLLKKALSSGLPISLPLLNHEIKTLQIEDFTASVGKVVVRDYTPFSFRVYFFTPSDFFTGDLQSALNIALAISFVIAAVAASVGGYVGVHFALAGVEELAEKMYRDPWQATTNEDGGGAEKSSNNNSNNNNNNKNKFKVEEVDSLQQEFVAFRAVIDMARGFVVASGGGAGVGGNNSDESDSSNTFSSPLFQNNNNYSENNNNDNSGGALVDDLNEVSAGIIDELNKDEKKENYGIEKPIITTTETENENNDDTNQKEKKNKKKRVHFFIEPPTTLTTLDDEVREMKENNNNNNNNDNDNKADPDRFLKGAMQNLPIKIKTAPKNYLLVACIKFMVLTSSLSKNNNKSNNTNNNNNRSIERNQSSKQLSSQKPFFSTSSTNNNDDDSMMNTEQTRNSLLDVHSYFRVLDWKKKKMEQGQQSRSSLGPIEDKILLGRILSSACNVLLQSSGLSLIQFFGDSMLCYFRVRSVYNNSRMVIKFIANICKLQQRLGEGNYHELFKNHDENDENNNNSQESVEEQKLLDRQQEFKIKNFLGKNLLSTTNFGDVQPNTQSSAENVSSSLNQNSQSESGHITNYAATEENQQQLHTHGPHDNFVLKICAGVSIGQAFLHKQQDYDHDTKNNEVTSANLNNTKTPSSTSNQPTRAVTVLGAAVSNAKTLCEEAPQIFCPRKSQHKYTPNSNTKSKSQQQQQQHTKSAPINHSDPFSDSSPAVHQALPHQANNDDDDDATGFTSSPAETTSSAAAPSEPPQHDNNKHAGFADNEEVQFNDDGGDSRSEGGTSSDDDTGDDIQDAMLGDDDDVPENGAGRNKSTIRRSKNGVLESMEGLDSQGLSPVHPVIAVPHVFRELILIPDIQRTKNSLRKKHKRLPVLDIASLKKMKARESEYDLLGALGHHQAHTSYRSALDALREKYLRKQRGENKTPDGGDIIPLGEFKSNLKVKVVRLLLSPEQ